MYFMTRPFVIPQFTTRVCQDKWKKNPSSIISFQRQSKTLRKKCSFRVISTTLRDQSMFRAVSPKTKLNSQRNKFLKKLLCYFGGQVNINEHQERLSNFYMFFFLSEKSIFVHGFSGILLSWITKAFFFNVLYRAKISLSIQTAQRKSQILCHSTLWQSLEMKICRTVSCSVIGDQTNSV